MRRVLVLFATLLAAGALPAVDAGGGRPEVPVAEFHLVIEQTFHSGALVLYVVEENRTDARYPTLTVAEGAHVVLHVRNNATDPHELMVHGSPPPIPCGPPPDPAHQVDATSGAIPSGETGRVEFAFPPVKEVRLTFGVNVPDGAGVVTSAGTTMSAQCTSVDPVPAAPLALVALTLGLAALTLRRRA